MVATRRKRDNIRCICRDACLAIKVLPPPDSLSVLVQRQAMKCAGRHQTRIRRRQWNRTLTVEIVAPGMDCGYCDSSDRTGKRAESVGDDNLINNIVGT